MTWAHALAFNPWGDDDSPYRVLDNRVVVTRYRHDCAVCFETIPAGAKVRAQREALDGKAMTFYFCARCCRAFARACRTGEIEAVERRYALAQQNAKPGRLGV